MTLGPYVTISVHQYNRLKEVGDICRHCLAEWKKILEYLPEGEKIPPESVFHEAISAFERLEIAIQKMEIYQ